MNNSAETTIGKRCATAGYQKHPARFAKGKPTVAMPAKSVAINPIKPSDDGEFIDDRVNFPTLTATGYVK